jgi:transposase
MRGKVTVSKGKTTIERQQALYRKLEATDKVALEAGNLAFLITKELTTAAGYRVYVLNPRKLVMIYKSIKKTDKEDASKLAYTREERLPMIPLLSERELKRWKLLSSYR